MEGFNGKLDTIKDNYEAFVTNFEIPFIVPESNGKGYYVYRNKEEYVADYESYVQYCYNIDYLNGWLYGAVQAKCKQLRGI